MMMIHVLYDKGTCKEVRDIIKRRYNMRRVAEIIHIVDGEREEFLNGALNPDIETQKVLWMCGVRKQQYFALNDLIFMTFEYKGNNFNDDMKKMAAYLDSQGKLVNTRRKDVPLAERENTNWWAPVKRLGTLLDANPFADDEEHDAWENDYIAQLDGGMTKTSAYDDISYDEDDWTESIHI